MAISLVCSSIRDGLPEGCTSGNPIRVMAGFYGVAKGTSMTYSDASALSTYTAYVISKTLLPVHGLDSVEDTSVEKKVEETDLGRKKTNHPGYRGYKFKIDLTGDEHQALKTWENANIDIIPYDALGNIYFAPSATTGYVKGFGISYFDVEKLPVATADASTKTMLEIQETETLEMDEFLYIRPNKATAIADRWKPTDVKTISKATITQSGSIAANAFVVDVALVSKSFIKDGSLASQAVTGLVLANFLVKDGLGAVVTPDSVTETPGTPGEYTVDCTGTGFTAGTVTLSAQASDEVLYESLVVTLS